MNGNSLPYWNHNTAYYEWIRKQIGNCQAILDVGCGDGTLIRFLSDKAEVLVGVDVDETCITFARNNTPQEKCQFICTSFDSYQTDMKFDAVIFVASLHHMEMRSSLKKSASLLKENGRIIIVGLADPFSLRDHIIEGLRVIPSLISSRLHHMKTAEELNIPTSYALPDMQHVRNVIRQTLPGAKLRFGLHYRYLVSWQRKGAAHETADD